MSFRPYFAYFLTDFGELRTDPPVTEFRENWCIEGHTVRMGVNEILSVVGFHLIWRKLDAECDHKRLLSGRDVCENRTSESHAIFRRK